MEAVRKKSSPRTRRARIRDTKSRHLQTRATLRKHQSSMSNGNAIGKSAAVIQSPHQTLIRKTPESVQPIETKPIATVPAQEAVGQNNPTKNVPRKNQAKRTKRTPSSLKPLIRMRRAYKNTRFFRIWVNRPKFSYGFYAVLAIAMIIIATMFIWWSTQTNISYQAGKGTLFHQVTNPAYHALSQSSCYFTMFGLLLIYAVCITLVNRFWIGTALFGTLAMVFAVATKIKIAMRSEPIIPSDLGFLTGAGGGAGEVTSFITDDSRPLVNSATTMLIWFILICAVLQLIDRRRGFIYCSWRHPLSSVKNIFGLICRIAAPIVSIVLLVSYSGTISNPQSGTRKTLDSMGYSPRLWNVLDDAQTNGALTTFLSLTHVKVMDDEPDYSKDAMRQIFNRYTKSAEHINASRSQNLTDSTVIMVLSESFSDPNRVPGTHFDIDPMPNIRSLSQQATSGLMLSPGYGGGTANIEFQQMTGLSLANFSDTLLSPYQQLVATRPSFYSFNQIWNADCGGEYSTSCSVGFHPFLQSFYLRGTNYKKFGFSHFYTLDSNPKIKFRQPYIGPNGTSTTVSDEEAYKNVIDAVRTNVTQNKPPQYIQLITMQNHAPYPDVYDEANEFHAANKSVGVPGTERGVVDNYAKGVQRTDQATADFLNQLNEVDMPITVVFYGDHLPGIYSTANSDKSNALKLHETNYFIWSNKASMSHNTKLSAANAAYTSSNYFMAQAAQQMNARVSPYLALLDNLHAQIPAMSRPSTSNGTWSASGGPTYLDAEGEEMDMKTLSSKAKQLLADYKMVQYDMSVGKNYLMDMGFMDVPKQ